MEDKRFIRLGDIRDESGYRVFDAEILHYGSMRGGVQLTATEARTLAKRLLELADELDSFTPPAGTYPEGS